MFEQKIEPNNTQFSIPNFCKMEGTEKKGQNARKIEDGCLASWACAFSIKNLALSSKYK